MSEGERMDRRDAMKAALAAAVAGCSGSSRKAIVSQEESLAAAEKAIVDLATELKKGDVRALLPVVSEAEGKEVLRLRAKMEQIEKQNEAKDPRAEMDYRLEAGSVRRIEGGYEAVVRRHCGEGAFALRIKEDGVVYLALGERGEEVPFEGAIATTARARTLKELDDLVREAGKLREVYVTWQNLREQKQEKEAIAVLAGLAFHEERLEKTEAREVARLEASKQVCYRVVGLEKAIPFQFRLDAENRRVAQVLKIGGEEPTVWLRERIESLAE